MKTRNYADVIRQKLADDLALAQTVEEAEKLFEDEEKQYLIVSGWRISILANPGCDWWIDPLAVCHVTHTLREALKIQNDRDDEKEAKP